MAKKKTAKKTAPKSMKKTATKKSAKKTMKAAPKKSAAQKKTKTPKTQAKKTSTVKAKASKPMSASKSNAKGKSAPANKTPNSGTTQTTQPNSQQQTSQPSHLVGSEAPNLTLQDSQGQSHSLSEYKGKKIVLYFYPKDDTPGCTLEGQQFTELYPEFQKANTLVFGISRDSVQSHDKFKCKYGFGFELLSDEKEEACKAFDVIKEKNMYGKIVMGIERSTFIIDENGKIAKEYRKVSADGHAAKVLEDLKTI